jgi:uncharacterized protein with beta-barrel porin domain
VSGAGGTGGVATGNSGGGGGGAGESGGNGSAGAGPGAAVGGIGGSSGGGNGSNGGSSGDDGGGGGGGGGHRVITSILNNSGTLLGGAGGAGGTGGGLTFGGGGGGGGAYGAVISGAGASSNSGTVTGGAGGGGGAGQGALNFSGTGGGGGVGVRFTAGGSFTSSAGAIGGGAGGVGGAGAGGSNGGTGGAGGAGIVGTGLTVVSGSAISGGTGGTGGNSLNTGGTGGAGGAGISGAGLTITNSGSISGGVGGTGGTDASPFGAQGGTGGAGISGSGLTIVNSGTITGGNGGVAGGGAPAGGLGAAGIVGSNITVINSGTIIAGLAPSGANANAITFNGGTNVLELRAGSAILNGPVIAFSPADTFRLGGSADASLNVTQIGIPGLYQGFGVFEKTGTGTWTLTNAPLQATSWTIAQGTLAVANVASLGGGTLTFNGGTLQALGTLGLTDAISLNAGGGTIDTNGNNVVVSSAISGVGGLTKVGAGLLNFQSAQLYTGGTTINAGTLFLDSIGGSLPVGGALTVNGGLFDMSDIATGQSVGTLAGAGGQINLGANNLTTNSSASTTLATQIIGAGALIKQGTGVLTLTANNLYSGGTTISGGLINFTTASNFGTGGITLNGGGLQWAAGSTADISSRLTALGTGGGTLDTNGNNVTLASAISGTGGLTKQGSGLLNLTGANTYTGLTSVSGGTLAVNGSVTSNVTVGSAGTLGGTGTIAGTVSVAGTIAPGNSIGTLNVTGSFVQAAGSIYQVEANAAGQSDRINATGTATINGGTVQVIAAAGSYGASTTYTILTANGGRTGTYAGVTSNFAFLTPSLTYDANNVFLTLALLQGGGSGFLMSAFTPNQKAVGAALNQSFATATGDYATVIGALAGLTAFQGPAALNAISGEQYADFGTMNVNNSAMFMNAIGQQMALARGDGAGSAQRASLAQACDVAACDGASPFSVWGSMLGGVGSVSGDTNASTATYNFGGAAVGIDYRFDPRFLVGLATTYTAGNLWVNSFPGKGWSNNVGVAAYGSFTQGGFYADLLGGYAYFNNQLQRQIVISGLPTRTSSGSTGANQALGQVETGYRLGIYAPASATVAPFARLQGSSTTQNAFSEWGAQSLSLSVAQQTTNSLRTLFGVDFAGALPLGSERTLDVGLRLGWQHEYTYTGRPITAALSGAPFAAFTVYGATPQPDSAVVSFRANTRIAEQVQLYLRYDGDIGSGTDNHALNLGLRMSW